MRTNISPVKILDLDAVQLKEFIKLLGEPVSAADPILKCVYREGVTDFEVMTGLRPSLKQKLAEYATLGTLEPLQERVGRRQLLLPVNDNYICRLPSFLFWSFLLSGLRCWAAAVR